MIRRIRTSLVVAVASLATLAHARDFRSSDVHPTDYPTVEAVRQMGKQLSEQTKGKLGVKVFPAGALGSEKDTIEQLKIGGLDMMRINAAPLNNIIPRRSPFRFPSCSDRLTTCARLWMGRSATTSSPPWPRRA